MNSCLLSLLLYFTSIFMCRRQFFPLLLATCQALSLSLSLFVRFPQFLCSLCIIVFFSLSFFIYFSISFWFSCCDIFSCLEFHWLTCFLSCIVVSIIFVYFYLFLCTITIPFQHDGIIIPSVCSQLSFFFHIWVTWILGHNVCDSTPL